MIFSETLSFIDDGYPVFALNETAVKRQKRSAQPTTTDDYDEDYDISTPIPKLSTPAPIKIGQKLTTVIISRLPTKEPVAKPEQKSTVPQTAGNGLSGEFGDVATQEDSQSDKGSECRKENILSVW